MESVSERFPPFIRENKSYFATVEVSDKNFIINIQAIKHIQQKQSKLFSLCLYVFRADGRVGLENFCLSK